MGGCVRKIWLIIWKNGEIIIIKNDWLYGEMFRIIEFKSYFKFWEKSSNMNKFEEIEGKKKKEGWVKYSRDNI